MLEGTEVAIKCPKCHYNNPDYSRFCGNCTTPLYLKKETPPSPPHVPPLEPPLEKLSKGSTFADRYEIIEELGKGGMGRVYRVYDKKIDGEVALKLIKPEIAADKKTIERFRYELKIAREIAHRNICRMYDLNEDKGTHYITMEYVSGDNLKSYIDKYNKLSPRIAIKIARQVCEGLIEAHRLGVVHRDLKPQNIMIDKEGNARIMDFGIARSLKDKGITAEGVKIGTPEYMSPEQVEGLEVDQRSDIYSLGIVLYEMLTGRVPFEGDSPFSIGMKHKTETPKNPREYNDSIPEDLNGLVLKCLEKEKEKRFQSADEVFSRLSEIRERIRSTDSMETEIKFHPPKKKLKAKPKVKPKVKPKAKPKIKFKLKKLLISVLVPIAIIAVGAISWKFFLQEKILPLLHKTPSVAVLPFEDLSPQNDQEYLADGLADSIVHSLSNIKDLRVPAKSSSFLFKGAGVREVGKRFKVKNVLTGNIQKLGDRMRITAQLINVSDQSPIWSDGYERNLDAIFAVQEEIILAIVDELKVQLLEGEKEKLVKRYTENFEAYDLYLKGRYFKDKSMEENWKKAPGFFEEAIHKDPGYTLAYAGLANSCLQLAPDIIPPKEAYLQAKAAALKALEIDDTLAEIHTLLGTINFFFDWDWYAAEKEFKLAIDLNPNSVEAYQSYSIYLSAMGMHDKALAEIQKAQALDPLSLAINSDTAWIYFMAGEYGQAIEQYKKILALNPYHVKSLIELGRAYGQLKMFKQAIIELERAISLSPGDRIEGQLAYIYAVSNRGGDAQKILEKLIENANQRYISSSIIAEIYLGLGETDQSFTWLEKAYKERDDRLAFIKVCPEYNSLRSEQRFKALLKKMGLR